MPSNKNRDKLKQQELSRTGKNEVIYTTFGLCPAVEDNKIVYKVMELTFTVSGQCVSIEQVFSTTKLPQALDEFHIRTAAEYDIRAVRIMAEELNKDIKHE